jgi:hypothetical protein
MGSGVAAHDRALQSKGSGLLCLAALVLDPSKILIVYSNLAQMTGSGWRAGDAA